jgi:hypothetical protein
VKKSNCLLENQCKNYPVLIKEAKKVRKKIMEKEAKLKNTYTISQKLAQTKLYYDFFQDIQVNRKKYTKNIYLFNFNSS